MQVFTSTYRRVNKVQGRCVVRYVSDRMEVSLTQSYSNRLGRFQRWLDHGLWTYDCVCMEGWRSHCVIHISISSANTWNHTLIDAWRKMIPNVKKPAIRNKTEASAQKRPGRYYWIPVGTNWVFWLNEVDIIVLTVDPETEFLKTQRKTQKKLYFLKELRHEASKVLSKKRS